MMLYLIINPDHVSSLQAKEPLRRRHLNHFTDGAHHTTVKVVYQQHTAKHHLKFYKLFSVYLIFVVALFLYLSYFQKFVLLVTGLPLTNVARRAESTHKWAFCEVFFFQTTGNGTAKEFCKHAEIQFAIKH